jgi:hypothetical protein
MGAEFHPHGGGHVRPAAPAAQIGAGAESPARTGEKDGAYTVVLLEIVEFFVKLVELGKGDGVEFFRTVEGDDGNGIPYLVQGV